MWVGRVVMMIRSARNESGERSGVSPPVSLFLYRQADACRSPILSLITAKCIDKPRVIYDYLLKAALVSSV